MILVVGGLLRLQDHFPQYLLSDAYGNTWLYIPFLLLAVGCSCLSGFLSAKFNCGGTDYTNIQNNLLLEHLLIRF